MKTTRDIIDGTFRALYRAARTVDRLVTDDPFAALRWPRKIELEPDPFTADERDRILGYFRQRDPWYFPLVYLLFWTGLRVGEAVGLRCGDVGLREGKLSVRRSRTLGEDNPPKTARSVRTIPLRPEVIAVLRAMPAPLHRTDESFFFTNQAGRPLDEERFVEKHWHRALRATGIQPRKFYATRHTFISLTLMAGKVKIKRLADYCGTSVAMIEKHYARWMAEDTPEEIGGAWRTGVAGAGCPGAGRCGRRRRARSEPRSWLGPPSSSGNLSGNLSRGFSPSAASREKD